MMKIYIYIPVCVLITSDNFSRKLYETYSLSCEHGQYTSSSDMNTRGAFFPGDDEAEDALPIISDRLIAAGCDDERPPSMYNLSSLAESSPPSSPPSSSSYSSPVWSLLRRLSESPSSYSSSSAVLPSSALSLLLCRALLPAPSNYIETDEEHIRADR